MNDRSQSWLASILTFAIGAWLMISPLFISVSGAALVSVLITGGIIALAGLIQMLWMNTLPSWVVGLAAVWLVVSAMIFSATAAFAWSVVLSALAAFALAIWDGVEVDHVAHRGHQAPV